MGKAESYNGRAESIDHPNHHKHSRRQSSPRDQQRNQRAQANKERRTSDPKQRKPSSFDVDEHPFELRHEVKKLNSRLDKIADSLEKADIKNIVENYMSPKKRLITNFTAGLSRGLGMTVGTFIVLGLLGYILSLFVDMPLIGDYIAELQKYINQSM